MKLRCTLFGLQKDNVLHPPSKFQKRKYLFFSHMLLVDRNNCTLLQMEMLGTVHSIGKRHALSRRICKPNRQGKEELIPILYMGNERERERETEIDFPPKSKRSIFARAGSLEFSSRVPVMCWNLQISHPTSSTVNETKPEGVAKLMLINLFGHKGPLYTCRTRHDEI